MNVLIDGSFVPDKALVDRVLKLKAGQALVKGDTTIAYSTKDPSQEFNSDTFESLEYAGKIFRVENTWDIFSQNGEALQADFELLTQGRQSEPISPTNSVIHPENIFLEKGAKVEYSILNASEGPIYLGENSLVMEGNMIRGGLALCENAVIKMGAKVYGPTTIGPYGKVCGEIK